MHRAGSAREEELRIRVPGVSAPVLHEGKLRARSSDVAIPDRTQGALMNGPQIGVRGNPDPDAPRVGREQHLSRVFAGAIGYRTRRIAVNVEHARDAEPVGMAQQHRQVDGLSNGAAPMSPTPSGKSFDRSSLDSGCQRGDVCLRPYGRRGTYDCSVGS